MKVLFIAKNIPLPNYHENDIILNQVLALKNKNIEVDLFYPREFFSFLGFLSKGRMGFLFRCPSVFKVKNIIVSSIYYIRIPFIKRIEWRFSNRLLNLFNPIDKYDFNYDIIHSHFVFPDAIIGDYLSKKYKVPHVVTIREGDYINLNYSKNNRIIFNRVMKDSKSIVAMTPCLIRGVPLDFKSKVTEIPSFIHDDFFTKPIVSKVNEDLDCIKFIVVSKFLSRKNLDWILDFFLQNKHLNASLALYGDGVLFDEYRKLAEEDLRITFHGYQNRSVIIDALDVSDIFVLPSANETFGLVYAEAASRKNIVLGLSNTGLFGVELNGFLFCSDKNDFFEKMYSFFDLSRDDIESLKVENFNYSRLYSSNNYTLKINELYNNMLEV
ncbi:glycosyltransferase [Vibrio fluvialis]|nr:glycosyltransferase [Vibrio fluvialis]